MCREAGSSAKRRNQLGTEVFVFAIFLDVPANALPIVALCIIYFFIVRCLHRVIPFYAVTAAALSVRSANTFVADGE